MLDQRGQLLMRIQLAFVIAGALLVGCASGPRRVPARLVADRSQLQGCELLTLVNDTDIDDLRDKAARKGGNAVLVTGQAGADVTVIIPVSALKYVGEVYRCP